MYSDDNRGSLVFSGRLVSIIQEHGDSFSIVPRGLWKAYDSSGVLTAQLTGHILQVKSELSGTVTSEPSE